jgi:ABC-2 type transport system ATP-binding protein
MSIIVENVTKLYGKQKALNNVSLEIKTGEIVGFIGPNGAGKSTLMKIICGFIPPTEGKIKVSGYDVFENSLEIRKNIGYLPEHNPLYPEMYVKEYLEYVGGIYKIKNKQQLIKEIVKKTGLEKEQHKKIVALSKGYRQRVGLAQALIHDPLVLILDEPTTGLDPNQIIEIRNLISETGKSKTIMLSTHIMQEVEAICSRIIIINKGEIVANESAKAIYENTGSNEFIVLVEFSEEIKDLVFQQLPFVDTSRKINNKSWLLGNKEGKDFRENIFRFAVENGYSILSMQKQERSLEDVFQELTKQ